MKLIYLFNSRLPTEKAYGIQVAKMCEAFADSGQEVKLLYPYRKNPTINQDIFSYYSIKNNFSSEQVKSYDFYWHGFLDKVAFLIKNYFSAKALAGEALKENADIFYTRDELVAYFLSKKNRNVIFECHRFSNKRKKFYTHFKKIDLKIVAISDGLKEDLVKFGIKDANILVARDGVDLKKFNIDISKEDARKMFFSNLHGEEFRRKKIAVYIGHLYSWKGAALLLEVARNFQADVLFVFVGGTEYDVNVFREKARGLSNIMVLGQRPYKEIPFYLKAADCAILTGNESETISAKYTSPLKMFEYMASGCPIVAQKLPSFREVLNDKNSFLVEPGNAKALADQINFVFRGENAGIVRERAAKALEDVKNYTWAGRVRKILDFTPFFLEIY